MYSVTTLTNGDHSIDVIKSTTWALILPIFMFHSTIIMNYILHDGFFSAYPQLTTRKLGIKHGASLADEGNAARTQACFEKYEKRRYDLDMTTLEWDITQCVTHLCGRSWHCPLTLCSTFDPGCLFAPFEASVEKMKTRAWPVRRCFEGKRAVVWYICRWCKL